MKRGEIWTVAVGGPYTRKPRPAVVLQANAFRNIGSMTLCPFTTTAGAASPIRPLVHPTRHNGLVAPSYIMIDKIVTVPRDRIDTRLGMLDDEDMFKVNRALIVFLGLSG